MAEIVLLRTFFTLIFRALRLTSPPPTRLCTVKQFRGSTKMEHSIKQQESVFLLYRFHTREQKVIRDSDKQPSAISDVGVHEVRAERAAI